MTATRPPGGSVFLVEDEVMIRMMVADMLEELGYSVAAEAGEINEAMKLAQIDRVRPRDPRRQRQRQGDFAGRRIDQGAQPPLHLRHRLRLVRPAGGISRPPGAAKAVPARNAGQDDRHRAEEPGGLGPAMHGASHPSQLQEPISASPPALPKTPRRCDRAAAASPRRSARPARRGRCLRPALRPAPARSKPIQKYGLPRPSRRSSTFRKPRLRLPCRVTRTPSTSSGAQAGKLTLITVFLGTPASITLRRISGPNFSAVSHSGAWRVSTLNSCAQRKRRQAQDGAFQRARDGAGIDHVLGDVAALVDARQHEVGLGVAEDVPRAHDHAIGRRAPDREMTRADFAQPQADRSATANARRRTGRAPAPPPRRRRTARARSPRRSSGRAHGCRHHWCREFASQTPFSVDSSIVR